MAAWPPKYATDWQYSTPTFLYFDLHLNTASAAHYIYIITLAQTQ